MVSDSYQNSIIVLFKFGDILYSCVGFECDTRFEHKCNLVIDDFSWHTIRRNTILKHSSSLWKCLLDCYRVALFSEVISGSHTGRARTDYANPLACIRKLFSALFPVFTGIMLHSVALDIADRNSLVDLFSSALTLAHMRANVAEALWERKLLTNNSRRLVILSFFNKTDISRYICVCRASRSARNKLFLSFDCGIIQLVTDSTCRTNLGARSAKTAVLVLEKFIVKCSNIIFHILFLVLKNSDSSKLVTSTDTSATGDASVHIVVVQRISCLSGKSFYPRTHTGGRNTHILNEVLKLAVAVLRASGAVLGMSRQNKLHGEVSKMRNLLAVC